MTAHVFFSRGAACVRTILAAVLLWAVASGSALAQQYTVRSVVINGGTTTVNTAPGSLVTVDVTVQNFGWPWRTTQFVFSPGGTGVCVVSENGTFIGTRTVRYSIRVPATNNLFSLAVSVHSHSGCKTVPGHTSSAAFNFPNAINTRPVVAGVDHLRIEHDGNARTCGAETVTLKACADSGCTVLYTPATTVTLTASSGAWAPVTQTFTGGITTAQLTKGVDGIVRMGGSISSPVPKGAGTICVNNGVLGNCDILFSTTSCRVDAVETGKNAGTPIYTKTTAGFKLDVVTLNASSAPTNTNGPVKAQLVDEASCATTGATVTALSPEVTQIFNNVSRLSFTFAPNRAARRARVRIVNGDLTGCSNDLFAIRPATFAITATGIGADATGTSLAVTPILKAGTTTFTLTAASSAGYDVLPVLNNNRLYAADVAGAGTGSEGVLAGNFVLGNGTASGSFTYSEVGYVKLLPYALYDNGNFALVDSAAGQCRADVDEELPGKTPLGDANVIDGSGMIACYFGNAETAYFGRFVPDRFVLGAATLQNRSALTSCTMPTFTYMGEAMKASVALTAVNGAGAKTVNYSGIFNRLKTPATQLGINAMDDAPGARTAFPACGATKAHPCIEAGVTADEFADGAATFTLPLTVFRPTGPVGPYDYLKVGLAPIDLDDVRLAPATYTVDTVTVPIVSAINNHVLLANTRARYGRMNIDNAYGSELLNLSMGVSAQYYNASGYATNTLDSCTPLASANFTLTDYRRGITATNMGVDHVMAGGTLAGGKGRVVLTKPVTKPDITGSVVLKYTSDFLSGSGRGTFGVYKAGPVIYVRETY